MKFSSPTHVRWDDLDAFGHLNNAKYLVIMQEARADMFFYDRMRKGLPPVFTDMVVARAEVDFLEPIYDGGFNATVEMWVDRIGNASFDMWYEIKSDKGLHARGKTVQVCVSMETKKARRLTDEEKTLLSSFGESN